MRLKVEQPTENEWVMADEQNMVHYYAVLHPARLGSHVASQLIIAILGEYCGYYCIEDELYSNVFYAKDPLKLAIQILTAFVQCRSLVTPVELVYDWGGQISHELPAYYAVKEDRQ